MSTIVTFYSYKGGVGRSMALANVAWLLSTKYGKKVLVVDWDLEAPGLHRFFGIASKDIKVGLIDLFEEYKALLKEVKGSLPTKLVDLKQCFVDVPLSDGVAGGSLSLIGAGKGGDDYVKRVNAFDWNEFYETWHGFGFFEYLKKELKENAEIILLDSRTGVTDIGGICTLQLPDIVVLLFALNEQNISGTEFIAESILKSGAAFSERSKPPALILRPARVEKYLEQDKKNEWEEEASSRLTSYLPPESQDNPLRYMKQNGIPYVGAYGFGERPLAVEAVERHDDEPALSFNALAVSILKASGLWNERYGAESVDGDFGVSTGVSPRLTGILFSYMYLFVIITFLVFFMITLWPHTNSVTGELDTAASIFGVHFSLSPDRRLLWLSVAAGALGSCISATRRLSWYIGYRRLAKPWLRYFFLQPVVGMLASGICFFVILGGLLGPGTVGKANAFGIVALSTLLGLFSEQALTKLSGVFSALLSSPPKIDPR